MRGRGREDRGEKGVVNKQGGGVVRVLLFAFIEFLMFWFHEEIILPLTVSMWNQAQLDRRSSQTL